MHTFQRLHHPTKNASGKDLESFILSLHSRSAIPIINELIRLHAKYETIEIFQETLANIAGITREHANRIIRILVRHGLITKTRNKIAGSYLDAACTYTINPMFITFKSYLSRLLPSLKKCLAISDITNAWDKITHINEYNNAVEKVTAFQHSVWSFDHQLGDFPPNATVITTEISSIFGGEALSNSSSSKFSYKPVVNDSHLPVTVNEESPQDDHPSTKEPVLWQETVHHFTKMLEEFENDWRVA